MNKLGRTSVGILLILAVLFYLSLTLFILPKVSSLNGGVLSYNGKNLTDMTVFSGDKCYAEFGGMRVEVNPCNVRTWSYDHFEQTVNFTWTGAQSRNISWIFVYDGDLKSGGVDLWRNESYNVTESITINDWINNHLVDRVISYIDLGAPDYRCQLGNLNNTRMFTVNRINVTNNEIYCFTNVTIVNSTAFRISGNRDSATTRNISMQGYHWTSITDRFEPLGKGLLNDNRSYYKVNEVTFNPGQSYFTNWKYEPENSASKGKWHIVGYEKEYGLINSINDDRYLYMDPSWSSSDLSYKLVGYWSFNETTTTANSSINIAGVTGTNGTMSYTPSTSVGAYRNNSGMKGTSLMCRGGSTIVVNATKVNSPTDPNIFNTSTATGDRYSWSAWIYPFGGGVWDDGASGQIIGGRWLGGVDVVGRVGLKSSREVIYHDGTAVRTTNNTVTLNAWNHLVVIWNSSQSYIFINGQMGYRGGASNPTDDLPFGLCWYMGAAQTYHFNGTIDEVAYWSRDINFTDVAALYNGGAGFFYGDDTTDPVIPQFYNYSNDNGTILNTGFADLNVSINNTNGTVLLQMQNTNYTASNTSGLWNVTLPLSVPGDYPYQWITYGNGTLNNTNVSGIRYYTVLNLSAYFEIQQPADVSTASLFTQKVNISYNFTHANTFSLWFKQNSTLVDCGSILNFSYVSCGYQSYKSSGSLGYNDSLRRANWTFDDNIVYPARYNYNQSFMAANAAETYSIGGANTAVITTFHNVSNNSVYSVLELDVVNESATSNALLIYYCNATYSNANIKTDSNCVNFGAITTATVVNHTHPGERDFLVPLGINVSGGGLIGTVRVTPFSRIAIFGATGGWTMANITQMARSQVSNTTLNNGLTQSAFIGTPAMHIHQYTGEESIWYFASATNGTTQYNTTVRTDLLNLSGLPPSSPTIIVPKNGFYKQVINVTYFPAISPNGYQIHSYNISLLNVNESYNSSVLGNNTFNTNYTWNTTSVPDATYKVMVTAYDSEGLSSIAISENFTIDNTPPNITLIVPENHSIKIGTTVDFIFNISDANGVIRNATLNLTNASGALFYDNTTTVVNGKNNNISASSLGPGKYYWTITSSDYMNITNTSIIYNFTLYTFPSNVTLSDPKNNYTTKNPTIQFNGTILPYSLEWYIKNYSVYLWPKSGATVILPNATFAHQNTILSTNYTTTLAVSAGYEWNFYTCYDNATGGNISCKFGDYNQTFMLDTIAPEVVIRNPNTTINYSGTIQVINFSAKDIQSDGVSTNLQSCWYSNNSGKTNTTIGAGAACYNNVTISHPAVYGYNNWSVGVNDSANNSDWDTVQFLYDPYQPTLDFNAPTSANNSYVNNDTLYFNITANETFYLRNVTMWVYNWSDGLLATFNGTPINGFVTFNGTYNVSLAGLRSDEYHFNATACDTSNNCNYTGLYNVSLDFERPQIYYVNRTLNPGAYVGLTALWFNVSATDRFLKNITFLLHNGTAETRVNNTHWGSNSSFFYNFTSLADGYYNFTAFATDVVGLKSVRLLNFSYQIDGNGPTMTYLSPTPPDGDAVTGQAYIPINVSATDISGVASITIYIWRTDNVTLVTSATSLAGEIRLDKQFVLPDGSYTYNVTAVDNLGNRNWLALRSVYLEFAGTSVTVCRDFTVPGSYIIIQNITNNGLNAGEACMNATVDNVNIDCRGKNLTSTDNAVAFWSQNDNFNVANCYVNYGSGSAAAGYKLTKGTGSVTNFVTTTTDSAIEVDYSTMTINNVTSISSNIGIHSDDSVIQVDRFNASSNVYGIFLLDTNYSNFRNIRIDKFTGTKEMIRTARSNYNNFYDINMSDAADADDYGLLVFNWSSSHNTLIRGNFSATADIPIVNVTVLSLNNTFIDTYYATGQDFADTTSQLFRKWTYVAAVKDKYGGGLAGSTVNVRAITGLNTSVLTGSDGTVTAQAQDYEYSYESKNTSNQYTFDAAFNALSSDTRYRNASSPFNVELTVNSEVTSTKLSRAVGRIIMVMILLIAMATSSLYFIYKMRDGESIADVWRYFVMMIIWNVIFLVLFIVLGGVVMDYFYPSGNAT